MPYLCLSIRSNASATLLNKAATSGGQTGGVYQRSADLSSKYQAAPSLQGGQGRL